MLIARRKEVLNLGNIAGFWLIIDLFKHLFNDKINKLQRLMFYDVLSVRLKLL